MVDSFENYTSFISMKNYEVCSLVRTVLGRGTNCTYSVWVPDNENSDEKSTIIVFPKKFLSFSQLGKVKCISR